MQIVIDIPEEMYQKIKETSMIISGRRNGRTIDYTLFNAVNEELTTAHYMAIEALKRPTSRWSKQTDNYHDYYECENCGMGVGLDDVRNFCPKCGADMRESEDKK